MYLFWKENSIHFYVKIYIYLLSLGTSESIMRPQKNVTRVPRLQTCYHTWDDTRQPRHVTHDLILLSRIFFMIVKLAPTIEYIIPITVGSI